MIVFRKAHPSIARSRFWREDVRWYGVGAAPDISYYSHALTFCLRGTSAKDVDIYVMINGFWQDLPFVIQEDAVGDWLRVVDTTLPSPFDICEPGKEQPVRSLEYLMKARSTVVLIRT